VVVESTSADEYARPVDLTKTTGPRAVARVLSDRTCTLNRSRVIETDPDDPETPVPME
jgi:hypothetical protein